nr:MAG TPA: hypothetical protein [Caudoviricetes sp.]
MDLFISLVLRTINKKIPGLKGPFIIHKNTNH